MPEKFEESIIRKGVELVENPGLHDRARSGHRVQHTLRCTQSYFAATLPQCILLQRGVGLMKQQVIKQ